MISRLVLRRTSLIDFPGLVSAVAFLPGCSLACPYCHNAALARAGEDPGYVSLGEFLGFLDSRRGKLDGIVLSGGEPCINDDLPRLVEAIIKREMRVKLDTNGMHPETLASSIEAGVSYVALDLKTDPARYALLKPKVADCDARLASSVEAIRRSGVAFEFRVTCAPGIVDARAIGALGPFVREGDALFLQAFAPGPTLDPAWSSMEPLSSEETSRCLVAAQELTSSARMRDKRKCPDRAVAPARA